MVQAGAVKEANQFVQAFSFGDRTRSFLKVQDGCDYKCTFCTIPQARGRSRSNTVEQVVADAQQIAAMGVRVRKWVTMHGLALNVDPDLGHFQLIVPCGLAGRPVTSMRALLDEDCPGFEAVKSALADSLAELVRSAATS